MSDLIATRYNWTLDYGDYAEQVFTTYRNETGGVFEFSPGEPRSFKVNF